MLKNATTLREKILILNTLFGKKILSSLHYTGSSRADMYMDMVLDFALIKGVKDGNYVYTAWDAVRDDLYLQPYVMGRADNIDYLSDYVCAILNDIVCGLVEYKDKFGNTDHNIVSFIVQVRCFMILKRNALFVNYKNKRIRNEYKAIE